jgi:hypothetical protein
MKTARYSKTFLNNLLIFLISLLMLSRSAVGPGDMLEQIRAYTRMIEFDYINWTLDALLVKNIQATVKVPAYMTIAEQRKVVFEYFDFVNWVNQTSNRIDHIYANPDIKDPAQAAAEDNRQLTILRGMEQSLKPIAESILQYQVSVAAADLGLGLGGQPIPPVLYHSTRLPEALIISPRNVIRQEYDISLQPEITTQQEDELEGQVEKKADVSALVVPIGGVGIYPTMVMSTTDLNWLVEVISHEWTHNFLTLHPLGLMYDASSQMRTINETTANLSGKEIGLEVLKRFYPDRVPPEQKANPAKPAPKPAPEDPNAFNFNREMHKTRVQVDTLLAQNKIKEAEDYMEQRRRFFWDHGYQIRKLNQAYFAFYGAYNDVPGGGAAGTDPVGPAVQQLRKQSKSLADFLNRIAWLTSFDGLQQELKRADR